MNSFSFLYWASMNLGISCQLFTFVPVFFPSHIYRPRQLNCKCVFYKMEVTNFVKPYSVFRLLPFNIKFSAGSLKAKQWSVVSQGTIKNIYMRYRIVLLLKFCWATLFLYMIFIGWIKMGDIFFCVCVKVTSQFLLLSFYYSFNTYNMAWAHARS